MYGTGSELVAASFFLGGGGGLCFFYFPVGNFMLVLPFFFPFSIIILGFFFI